MQFRFIIRLKFGLVRVGNRNSARISVRVKLIIMVMVKFEPV